MIRKQNLKRRTPLRPGSAPARRKHINRVNRARRAAEFARCYHSKERVAFVRRFACSACGAPGPSDNAHVTSDETNGMSRKAGYECIAPLCRRCHEDFDGGRMDSLKRYRVIKNAFTVAYLWRRINGEAQ